MTFLRPPSSLCNGLERLLPPHLYVQFVLERGSDSELSELDRIDFEENTNITTELLPRIHKVEGEVVEEGIEEQE